MAGKEVQFPCPSCGHKAHYFNPYKGVGFCHAAACHRVSTVASLEEVWGEIEEFAVGAPEPEEAPVQVELPKNAELLVVKERGQLVTRYPEAVQALTKRNLTAQDAYMNNFYIDPVEDRLIIPIIFNGELVNYVSRAVWWYLGSTDSKRYMYAKGASTSSYLFKYESIPDRSHLAIVENTFNAIWLNKYFPCTSAFGSYLSKEQIALLSQKVSGVVLMWDRGAEDRAKAMCKLMMKNAILCRFVEFTGKGNQPDDYPLESLCAGYKDAVKNINVFHWTGGIKIADV